MFTFTLLVVGAMVVAYFGLSFGYAPFLENRISQVDSELSRLSSSIPQADQENFISFYSQLVHVRELLQKHINASAVFPVLEKNTHTQIHFTNFDFSADEFRVGVEGVAANYEVLSQQLAMLDKVAEVSNYVITESQAVEGRVRFRLNIFFNPEVFSKNI